MKSSNKTPALGKGLLFVVAFAVVLSASMQFADANLGSRLNFGELSLDEKNNAIHNKLALDQNDSGQVKGITSEDTVNSISPQATSSVKAVEDEITQNSLVFRLRVFFLDAIQAVSAKFDSDVQVGGDLTVANDVEVGNDLVVDGTLITSEAITAPNVVYSIVAGTGITVSGEQDITIINSDPGSSQNIFRNIKIGSNTISASSNSDTVTLEGGSGISLSNDGKTITVSASGSDLNVSGWNDDGSSVRLTTISDNVGIGTTSPTAKLHVVGTSYFSGQATFAGGMVISSGINNSSGGITNAGAITGATGFTSSGTITLSSLSTGIIHSNVNGVLSSSAINLAGGGTEVSGVLPVTSGGIGLSSVTTGDILYATGANTLAALGVGAEGEVLTVSGGIPDWGSTGAGSPCATCIVNNPGSTQTITPTAATATGLVVKQASSGSVDVFRIESYDGTGTYLKIDSAGNVVLGDNTTSGTFTVSPASTDPISIDPVTNGGTTNTGTLTSADLTAARTWTFPDESGIVCLASGNCAGTSAGLGGSGTTNYIARWSSTYGLTNSILYDNGTNVGIGSTSPGAKLDIVGTLNVSALTTLAAELQVNQHATISGSLRVDQAVDFNSTLGVTGATTLGSTLDVTGLATFGGNVGIGSSAPTAKFELVGSADVKQFIIKANSTQTATVPIMQIQNSAGTELMSISTNADTGVWIGAGVASLTATPGQSQILIGQNAGRLSTGIQNVFVGENSGRGNTTGTGNAMVGYRSSYINTTGSYNAFFGGNAGFRNQTGNNNVMIGYAAGYNNTASYLGADNNVFIGYQSGYSVTTNQDGNVFLGYQAGYSETGSNKLYIENSNSSLPLIYGDFSTDTLGFTANVGIGTTVPISKLHVTGAVTGKALALLDETGNQAVFVASASGTNRFIIQNDGNVGIGSATPAYALDVNGNIGLEQNLYHRGDDDTFFRFGVDQWQISAGGAQFVEFSESTTDIATFNYNNLDIDFRIDGDTNDGIFFVDGALERVGIGSTLPGYALDVVGELNLTDAIRSAGDAGTSGYLLTSSGGGAMTWTDPATLSGGSSIWTNTANVYHPYNQYASIADLVLGGTATASATVHLRSDGQAYFAGNVGIGSTSPAYKLDVSGNLNLTSGSTLSIGGTALMRYSTSNADNLFFGNGGATSGSTDDYNLSIGIGALTALNNSNGDYNVAIGYNALNAAYNTAQRNVAIGYAALAADTAIDDSIAIGYNALAAHTSGNGINIAIGSYALDQITGGERNVVIGYNSMGGGSASGSRNVVVGNEAFSNGTTGSDNTIVGQGAANNLQSGGSNAFFGNSAGAGVTTGSSNTCLGSAACGSGTITGSDNVAIGKDAAKSNLTGANNVMIGSGNGSLTSGARNLFIGPSSGRGVTTGNDNVFIGNAMAYDATTPLTGNYNVMIGGRSDFGGVQGTAVGNVTIGRDAGKALASDDSYNVMIGYSAGAQETGSNKLYIENTNTTTPLIYGDFSSDIIGINGQLGVATQSPTGKFEVNGKQTGKALAILNETGNQAIFVASASGVNKFTIANSGNVGIGTASPNSLLNLASGALTIGTNGDCNNDFCLDDNSIDTFYDYTITNHNTGNLFLMPDGNVGIGTTTTSSKLDVYADRASQYAAEFFNDGNNVNRYGLLVQAGLDDQTAAGPSTLVQFNDGDGGAVGSITFGSSVTNYNTSSDIRLKNDFGKTSLGLQDLLNITVHDYAFKADSKQTLHTGFMAQELYEIYPDAVTAYSYDTNKYWQIDYGKLTPLLVRSIQEQNEWVEELSLKIDGTGEVVSNLESQFDDSQHQLEIPSLADMLDGYATLTQTVWTFMSEVVFNAKTRFMASVEFVKDVTFNGSIRLSKENAGTVVIPQGVVKVKVSFDRSFSQVPNIYLTNKDNLNAIVRIAEVTTEYFVLELNKGQENDTSVQWLAVLAEQTDSERIEVLETDAAVSNGSDETEQQSEAHTTGEVAGDTTEKTGEQNTENTEVNTQPATESAAHSSGEVQNPNNSTNSAKIIEN